VLNYVLQRAGSEDEERILEAIQAGIEAIPVLLEQGEERAKTQLHGAWKKHQPKDGPAQSAGE
jgi:peptidyl-tRNA hydrolase